jgi:uncharacterized membrane protein
MTELNYLKAILLSQLLIETMDSLKGSRFYKESVKYNVNRSIKELEQVFNTNYNNIYDNNPEMTTNVLNKLDALVDKLSTSSVDELVMIDSVIEKYHENKEWFKKHGEAEFLKIE